MTCKSRWPSELVCSSTVWVIACFFLTNRSLCYYFLTVSHKTLEKPLTYHVWVLWEKVHLLGNKWDSVSAKRCLMWQKNWCVIEKKHKWSLFLLWPGWKKKVHKAPFKLLLYFYYLFFFAPSQKSAFCHPVFDFLPLSPRPCLWLLAKPSCLPHLNLRRTVLLCSVKVSSISEWPPKSVFPNTDRWPWRSLEKGKKKNK